MLRKSLFIVIACLFIGAFSTQLSAQSESVWSSSFFYTQVYCDGEVLGWAYGTMDYHYVEHYKKGELVSIIYQAKGDAVCNFSDEKFSYKEKGKIRIGDEVTENYVIHLKGDQGSRYMMHITIDQDTWEWIFGPANCK
jgi:hypothetical protein